MVDRRLEQVRERAIVLVGEGGAPGLALAVADGSGASLIEGFGFADREEQRRVTPETLFALASVSKIFTATAVTRAVRAESLSFADPVSKWLPELSVPGVEEMTVHHLLAHTSGLPPLPSRYHALDRSRPGEFTGGAMDVDSQVLAGPSAERIAFADCEGLIPFLNGCRFEPLGRPGEVHNYSNEGYVLAAAILERATGRGFEDAVRELVLAPAGLARVAVGVADARRLGDVATTYHRIDGAVRPVPPWDAPAWNPAGGLRASARDLLRFFVSLDPTAPAFERQATAAASGAGYGYGAGIAQHHGSTVFEHDGGQDGVSAAFLWVPERRLAVVALANLDGSGAPELARAALNAMLELPLDTPAFDLAPAASAGNAAELAGTYASPEGARFELEEHEGGIAMRLGDQRVECPALGEDRIAVATAPARFLRRNGRVFALAIGNRIVPRAGDAPAQ